MKVTVFRLYENGQLLPKWRRVNSMSKSILGDITLETVRHKALDRPTLRLRLRPDNPEMKVPDLLDVRLQAIAEDEFEFGGIEFTSSATVEPQFVLQAWRVICQASK